MEDCSTWEWESRQVCLGLFDGHGGKEAALYATDHLYDNIQSFEGFETSEGEKVKKAIVEGFKKTHEDMWAVRGKEFVVKYDQG